MKVNLFYYKFVGNAYVGGACVVRHGSHGYTHGTMYDSFSSDTGAVGLTGPVRDSGRDNPTQAVTFGVTNDE